MDGVRSLIPHQKAHVVPNQSTEIRGGQWGPAGATGDPGGAVTGRHPRLHAGGGTEYTHKGFLPIMP